MGRPRLTVEEKTKRGTLEKSRELPDPSRMKPAKVKPGRTITAPDYLNKWGRQFYKFYYKALTETGVLTVTDVEALAMMSAEYGRYLEAQYKLQEEGSVVMGTNKNGSEYSMVSPYVAIASTSFKNFYNMMSRFGISPADRQKIGAYKPEEGEETNSLSSFLRLT